MPPRSSRFADVGAVDVGLPKTLIAPGALGLIGALWSPAVRSACIDPGDLV